MAELPRTDELTETERRKVIAEHLAQGVIRCQMKDAKERKRQKPRRSQSATPAASSAAPHDR